MILKKNKVYRADLHGHTVNSDGELTVLEVIAIAKEKGLTHYAITDHDCLIGADFAYDLGKDIGIDIIYGIELSTHNLGEAVHILGYFKDKLSEESSLRALLKRLVEERKQRAYKMFDLLKEHFGFELDKSIIEEKNSITRGTMSKMIEEKYGISKHEIFKNIIGEGCPCYIQSTHLDTIDGIRIIHENGGIAVLAHPCLLNKNDPIDIVKMGVDGIEAIYPKAFNTESKYRHIARKYNLVVTAGSDFHAFKDTKHGEIASCVIKGREVEKFIDRLLAR